MAVIILGHSYTSTGLSLALGPTVMTAAVARNYYATTDKTVGRRPNLLSLSQLGSILQAAATCCACTRSLRLCVASREPAEQTDGLTMAAPLVAQSRRTTLDLIGSDRVGSKPLLLLVSRPISRIKAL